jgi:DNA polymerase (family 10)/putative hydrolase
MKYADLLPVGALHLHTQYTAGTSTVDEYCEQAVKNRLRLLGFSEHVRRELKYEYDALLADIERARQRFQLTILSGCEAKVLDLDGSLDVTDEVLRRCEIVVASFHSFPHDDKESYLKALSNVIRHPRVDIWGHPTLFLKRRGLSLTDQDIRYVASLCKEYHVLIERNLRYDLPDAHFLHEAYNVTYVENSDAHSVTELRIAR